LKKGEKGKSPYTTSGAEKGGGAYLAPEGGKRKVSRLYPELPEEKRKKSLLPWRQLKKECQHNTPFEKRRKRGDTRLGNRKRRPDVSD